MTSFKGLAFRVSLAALAACAGCMAQLDSPGDPPSTSPETCASNLLANPGFETSTSGWVGFYHSVSSLARTTSVFHGGSASARLVPAGGLFYIGLSAEGLSLADGTSYTATWWVRVPKAGTYTAFVMTGNGADYGSRTDVTLAANTWTKLTSTFQPTAWVAGDQLAFRLQKPNTSTFATTEYVYFDDMQLACASTSDTTPPSAPGNLTATATSGSTIDLSWTASTDNVGVAGYELERCTGASCSSFTQLATASGTSYTDSGLAAATTYSYRVRASDAAGNLSAYSSVESATTSGGDATAPAFHGPFYAATNPWRTPLPSDWFDYVHPDTASMVQGVYIGTDYTSMDIHAFAYRPVEMQQKWGSSGLTFMKWAGPGQQENIVYVPGTQPLITVYVDWDSTTKTYEYRHQAFQVPLPANWTGYNSPHAGTAYFERRTSIVVNNAAGDLWIIYQPTPPGDPIRYLGTQTDTVWHATHVEKEAVGWKGAAAPYWNGGGSGNPFLAGTITPYDILTTPVGGHFKHAIAFNASWASDGSYATHPKFAYPSPYVAYGRHPATDGKTKTAVGIPHGARIFLDPSLTDDDLRALGLTKEWQLQIARTLQVYGGISKESSTGQGGAGGIITESNESIAWNIAQGIYPSGFKWPWMADGTMDSTDLDNSSYNAAFPPALMPTSGSHWKVFDWNKPYPGISAP